MRIAVLGTPNRIQELRDKVSSNHELIEVKNKEFEGFDIIFDLNFEDHPDNIKLYATLPNQVVVVNAVINQLEKAVFDHNVEVHCKLFGMNSVPSFINRSLAEMSSYRVEERPTAEELFNQMEWPIRWVESRVGMVTPRIIFMIINEAYYTVQEGTATKEDIDIGMKLGTAYPKGPFEWVEEIGLRTIYEALEALYQDTHDERYKVCPMLKTEYLRQGA